MRKRGWGRVITIGTRGVAAPLVNMVEYSAAKAALVNATGAIAHDLAGSGVTANVISPGVILTPGLRTMFETRVRDAGDRDPSTNLRPRSWPRTPQPGRHARTSGRHRCGCRVSVQPTR
jgi:3-oxoacyl-[acyl-carrier protein] reductase